MHCPPDSGYRTRHRRTLDRFGYLLAADSLAVLAVRSDTLGRRFAEPNDTDGPGT